MELIESFVLPLNENMASKWSAELEGLRWFAARKNLDETANVLAEMKDDLEEFQEKMAEKLANLAI